MSPAAAAVPTLVLLPGLACDARLWQPQLPGLSAAGPTRVATPHLGQGAPATLHGMAERLLDTQAGPLALAGCSMGAMVALHAWRLAPHRVVALALLGTTARPDTAALRALREAACAQFAAGRMTELLQANAMFAFHGDHLARHGAAYLAMVQAGGADALIRQNRAIMDRDDLRPWLPDVRCPALVIGGEDDSLTPPECAREIAQALPDARLALLPRCGHMLTWEQPEAVQRLLLDWRGRWA